MPKPDPDFDPDFATPAQWAQTYRDCGLQVIPCRMPGKRPLLSEWAPLQEKLVSDATFAGWYHPATGEHRNLRNMGIITGRASDNCYILDLDIHKNPQAMQWWSGVLAVHNNGMELDTPTQKTGGGGLQKLFRAPAGFVTPTNKTSIGIDIRGQGGFAVMPASLHESGKFYEWLPGMAPWEIPALDSPQWLLDEITKLVGAHGGGSSGQRDRVPPSGGEFDDFGNRKDGREEAMRDMVWRCVVKLRRASPIKPVGSENGRLIQQEYEIYERTVSVQNPRAGESKRDGLERENRGISAFSAKWQYAMAQWDAEVAQAAAQPDPNPEQPDLAAEFDQAADKAQAQAKTNPGALYERLNVEQIKAMPDPKWDIGGLIVERGLGFVYGPPGCLKTFIALDMALSIATTRQMWWDRAVERPGGVIYISSEGQADLKFRIMAWEANRKVNADKAPFRLIRQSINFMSADDVGKLLATVQAIVDEVGPVTAVFVDTVSRVLPGSDENLQKDMTVFVAACDAVRQRFGATVIGIHHTSRAGNMRGSTVIPGAGDFIIEVRREPGAETGSIFAAKIKAGEDGWEQFFKVTKLAVGALDGNTSLALDPIEVAPKQPGNGWPERDVCRQILAAIDEQWEAGEPWCFAHNTPRAAIINIVKRFHLTREVVKDMLETWVANKVIAEEIFNLKSQAKGYRKLIDI